MYEPRRFPIIPFAVIAIVVVVVGIGIYLRASRRSQPLPEPEAVVVVQPAPTVTPRLIATPMPTNTLPPAPTTTPAPDLRFGVVEREDGCTTFNAIATSILDGLDVRVATVQFIDADLLYQALANRDVDLTLCFQDPADRSYLTQYVGFLKTLNAPYFDNGAIRLQVMVNAANVVPLREEQPCMVRFLQAMTFSEPIDNSAEIWIADNTAVIAEWTACD
jgi:ABC-type proline/glycine betaine transport system substrate-binding protein